MMILLLVRTEKERIIDRTHVVRRVYFISFVVKSSSS